MTTVPILADGRREDRLKPELRTQSRCDFAAFGVPPSAGPGQNENCWVHEATMRASCTHGECMSTQCVSAQISCLCPEPPAVSWVAEESLTLAWFVPCFISTMCAVFWTAVLVGCCKRAVRVVRGWIRTLEIRRGSKVSHCRLRVGTARRGVPTEMCNLHRVASAAARRTGGMRRRECEAHGFRRGRMASISGDWY